MQILGSKTKNIGRIEDWVLTIKWLILEIAYTEPTCLSLPWREDCGLQEAINSRGVLADVSARTLSDEPARDAGLICSEHNFQSYLS